MKLTEKRASAENPDMCGEWNLLKCAFPSSSVISSMVYVKLDVMSRDLLRLKCQYRSIIRKHIRRCLGLAVQLIRD